MRIRLLVCLGSGVIVAHRLLTISIAGAAIGLAIPASSAATHFADPRAETFEPAPQPCPGPGGIVVRAAAPADARMTCEGAARAVRFLARAGIAPPPSTAIAVVQHLPGELRGRAVGCYRRASRDILLLSYQAFEAGGQWFRMPADQELYRSAAAHEMAHAVMGCHSEPQGLAVAAHEYVAYVVLFATMDPVLRNRLLAKFPGKGFVNTLQINEINHLVDPNQFAVDAWRHYLRRRDRAAWLREMISGRVVEALPREAP